ncbi:MAG: hypothetical protein OWT28_11850 [Firmicutes bacterium]|nr:hypothetical protein [Bacillota bacterium]
MAYRAHRTREGTTVLRNERLTALAGVILLILILAQFVITANLHAFIPIHILLGMLLAGPMIVKLFSIGYKFIRYYSGHPEFVRKGPPNIWMRLLGPLLAADTILVFASGFGLALTGPTSHGIFFLAHAASTAAFIPLVAVHVYAHIRKATRLVASDFGGRSRDRVGGRGGRLRFTLLGLILGVVGAVLMLPVASRWANWQISPALPTPFALGIVAAVFGVLIAIPILRGSYEK